MLVDPVAPLDLVQEIVRPQPHAVVDSRGAVLLLQALDAFYILIFCHVLSRCLPTFLRIHFLRNKLRKCIWLPVALFTSSATAGCDARYLSVVPSYSEFRAI